MDEKELEKYLKKLKELQDAEYPADDKMTATRAEYTTHIKTMRKRKKGCPLTVLTFLIVLLLAYLPGL